MTVGNQALKRRDEPRLLADVIVEDATRVRTVREAAGPKAELFIDANCSLDLYHARALCSMIEDYHIEFFEEPITQNDVRQMAELRSQTSIRLACGQNEGQAYRFRDMMIAGAVDIIQPNVAITGGFTQCQKIAALANGFKCRWIMAGHGPFLTRICRRASSNGGLVEWHYSSVEVCKQIYDGLPEAKDGWFKMSKAPGLGFELNTGRLRV